MPRTSINTDWLLSRIKDAPARIPSCPENTEHQTFPGTTHILVGGSIIGRIGCVRLKGRTYQYSEDWVINSWSRFTDVSAQLEWQWVDGETDLPQMKKDAVQTRASGDQAKHVTLEFSYLEPPTQAQQLHSLAAPNLTSRRTFRAYGCSGGTDTEAGTLYREVLGDGTKWVDHWMLYENWTTFTHAKFVPIEPSYGSRDEFLQAMNTRRGTTAGWRYVGVQSTWTAL